MSNSNRGARGLAAGAQQRHSAIGAMHQQAQKANTLNDVGAGYAGEPVGLAPQRDESEVSREVSNLMHNVDELHIALTHLEERLNPVMASLPPQPSGDIAAAATDSPLGTVLQGQAFSVYNAISRVHALMNAIRI